MAGPQPVIPAYEIRYGGYPYPKTIAEMIPVRLTELARVKTPPSCHRPGHGPMVARDLRGQTYEVMFCGVWFDCQHPGCGTSTSLTSSDLAAQLGAPYWDGRRWWRWDGTVWTVDDEPA